MLDRIVPVLFLLLDNWPTKAATLITSSLAVIHTPGGGEVLAGAGTIGLFLNAAIVGLKMYFDRERNDLKNALERAKELAADLEKKHQAASEGRDIKIAEQKQEIEQLKADIRELHKLILKPFRERDHERDEKSDGG